MLFYYIMFRIHECLSRITVAIECKHADTPKENCYFRHFISLYEPKVLESLALLHYRDCHESGDVATK